MTSPHLNLRLADADLPTARRIEERAVSQLDLSGMDDASLWVMIALAACHNHGTPLDFGRLLEFDDQNFAHDIYGIVNHLDPETGKLTDCFLPRCALPTPQKHYKELAPGDLAALQESVEKYRKATEFARVEDLEGLKGVCFGPSACPLCRRYLDTAVKPRGAWCKGCPVREHTGLPSCEGTPYYEDAESEIDIQDMLYDSVEGLHGDHIEPKRMRDIADQLQAEADFLQSLIDNAPNK